MWNEYQEHDTYDAYWQARNIRTALKNVKPAVLVVGAFLTLRICLERSIPIKPLRSKTPETTAAW
ncbi:CocE/NonD family hydrolase [Hymenobacter qilianensis]|uniref:CocE/NonD family hydrolase n=1 Tax=Hymenobacter qilianensis TaxID=1385715 RepID=UPI0021CDF9AA|nr:CocE/NonD family hydrolase [Hymenobacter qilianensis]